MRPVISILESHNASISPMLNPFHNIEVLQQSLCLALKPLCVYWKLSPYKVVKKEWEIKGIQRQHHDTTSTVAGAVGEKAHLGTKQC